jgi:hypothetical protein
MQVVPTLHELLEYAARGWLGIFPTHSLTRARISDEMPIELRPVFRSTAVSICQHDTVRQSVSNVCKWLVV